MSKTNCSICHKKIDTDVDTNYNISWYHNRILDLLIMDETCYLNKEKEYLDNYVVIWKETKKDGAIWIKSMDNGCYAHKDQNGQILKQKDCLHCQPWKKCVNCDKEIGDTEYFGKDGKLLCSMECVNIYNENIRKPAQEPSPKPQNDNKRMSIETKIILGVVITIIAFTIGVIGVKIYKRSRKITS